MKTTRGASSRFGRVVGMAMFAMAVSPTVAHADLITVNFAGTVTGIGGGLIAEFSLGDTASGSFTYESSTTARAGSTSSLALFDALTNFEFSVNSPSGYAASSNNASEIEVVNDNGFSDNFFVRSEVSGGLAGTTPDVAGLVFDGLILRLFDSSQTVISDALILPDSSAFGDFTSAQLSLKFDDVGGLGGSAFVIIDMDSLSAIPEPATLALFVIALGGLGFMARRRVA